MAFPSFVGTAALTQVESADPTAVNMPADIQSGELLIVVCSGDTGGVFSQSGGTDWTRLINTNQSTNIGGAVFAKIAAGSDTLSIQFEQNDLAAVAFRVTGHGVEDVATDITIASAIGADISPNPPNCNPGTSADYLWIEAFAADDDDETATFQTSGWTQIAQAESAQTVGSCMVAVAYLQATASSQDPGLMALGEAEQWVAFTLAIPPAAGPAEITGTLDESLADLTLDSSGTVDVEGTLDKSLAALAVAASGTVDGTATLDQTLAALALSGFATVDVTGVATNILDPLALEASGAIGTGITGTLDKALADLTLNATATVGVDGSVIATLGALALDASGTTTTAITGALDETLAAITLDAAATVDIDGNVSATLAALTVSASGAAEAPSGETGTLLGQVGSRALFMGQVGSRGVFQGQVGSRGVLQGQVGAN